MARARRAELCFRRRVSVERPDDAAVASTSSSVPVKAAHLHCLLAGGIAGSRTSVGARRRSSARTCPAGRETLDPHSSDSARIDARAVFVVLFFILPRDRATRPGDDPCRVARGPSSITLSSTRRYETACAERAKPSSKQHLPGLSSAPAMARYGIICWSNGYPSFERMYHNLSARGNGELVIAAAVALGRALVHDVREGPESETFEHQLEEIDELLGRWRGEGRRHVYLHQEQPDLRVRAAVRRCAQELSREIRRDIRRAITVPRSAVSSALDAICSNAPHSHLHALMAS